MKTEIVCAVIALTGTLCSVIISWFISQQSIKSENDKLQKTWDREDVVSSDDEFAQMAESVAVYIHSSYSKATCIGKVAALRSKEHGALAKSLDKLYSSIQSGDKTAVNLALSEVIEEKRKAKFHQEN